MKTIEGKVVALGSQGVGKTCMIKRYIEKSFTRASNPTIGASFFNCRLNVDNTRIKLQVWDTAGQERFRSMAPMYYRNANAAFLVFDLTRYPTFVAIKSWVTELKKNVEETMILAVIGNKSDLEDQRQVDTDEGQKYATKIGATYHEISALHDEGVERVFLSIATGLLQLSSGHHDFNTTLRVYDSNSPVISNPDNMLFTPSAEEGAQNPSIAHGIHERPHSCC